MRKGAWVGVVGVLCLVLVGLLVVVFWLRPGVSVSPSVVESSSAVGEPSGGPSGSASDEPSGEPSGGLLGGGLSPDDERWAGFPPPVVVPRVLSVKRDRNVYFPETLAGLPLSNRISPGATVAGAVVSYLENDKTTGARGLHLVVNRWHSDYKIFVERRSDLHHVGQAVCGKFRTGDDICMLVSEDGTFMLEGDGSWKASDVELEGLLQEVIADYRKFYGTS